MSLLGVLFSGLAAALTAQAATARLIYSMARDGMLPRALSHVGAQRQTPDRAILLTAPRRWVADSTSSIRDLPVLTGRRAPAGADRQHLS